jgi:hypothetical protein
MSKDDPRILEAVGHPAANTQTDALTARFNAACDKFNINRDPTIGGWLDDNVTVFSVSSNRPVTGKHAVINYFTQQFTDSPQFNPLSPIVVTQNGTTGTVEGSARWIDDNGPETISFVFKFVFVNNQWLLLSLWGS